MDFPTIPLTSHILSNPIVKKPIEFRAYTVGEESTMIQNKDMDIKEKLQGIRSVLKRCITSDHDIDKLPYVVIEHLFVAIRQYSAGEYIDANYRCKVKNDQDEDCGGVVPVQIDLSAVEFITDPDIQTTIVLHEDPQNGDIGVKMRYPTIMTYIVAGDEGDFKNLICHCVECIFQGDEVWTQPDDMSDAEWTEKVRGWWGTLTASTKMKVLQNFFGRLPNIQIKSVGVCKKCGHKHDFTYRKLTDFFI